MVRLPFYKSFSFLLVLTGLYIYPGTKLKSVSWQGGGYIHIQINNNFPLMLGWLHVPLYIWPLIILGSHHANSNIYTDTN